MSPRRQRDAIIRNSRPLRQERLDIPKRKMPKKGALITVIHGPNDDLTRIKEIIERYGLNVEFVEK